MPEWGCRTLGLEEDNTSGDTLNRMGMTKIMTHQWGKRGGGRAEGRGRTVTSDQNKSAWETYICGLSLNVEDLLIPSTFDLEVCLSPRIGGVVHC